MPVEANVFEYIFPIAAMLLSFMALLSSIRFIISRQGLYWVLPAIISLLLCFENLNNLLIVGEFGVEAYDITFTNTIPVLLSFLWYMMVIMFHYAMKLAIPENKYLNDSKKNKAEAIYMEKYERRKNLLRRRNKEEDASNRAQIPSIRSYRGKLVD